MKEKFGGILLIIGMISVGLSQIPKVPDALVPTSLVRNIAHDMWSNSD